MERWVGVGEPGRGKETGGEGREAPSLVSACWVPTRPPERAAQSRGTWKPVVRPWAARRWVGLVRGARARSRPRPELDQGPRLGARGERGSATPAPLPHARQARQLGFPGKQEKARQKQTLGELFPLAWNFIGNTCAGEAGTGGGGAGIFRSFLRGSGPGPAVPARRRRPGQLHRDVPQRCWASRSGAGRAGARAGSLAGRWGQPYLGGFPLGYTSSCFH